MTQTNLKGRTAARYLKSLAVAGDVDGAVAYARGQRWLDVEAVVQSLKSAIGPMSTSTSPLPSPAAVDFAEYIRPLSIIGRLQGLRRVPSRTRLIAATAGSTAYWAGESQPRPISSLVFSGETLEPLSVIAIIVNTRELVLSSNPSAEGILRADLGKAGTAAMDSAFIDPGNGGENLVMPASVLSDETPRASTGSALANIDADLDATIQALSDAGSDLTSATWVMLPRTALFLSRMRGTGGNLAYPDMTVRGGSLLGLPALTSTAAPGFGSPSGGIIALIDASEILLVDDDNSEFAITTKGDLRMVDESASPAETSVVSMFQTESIAIKAVRYVNWKKLRNGMAQYISGVNF
jgi:hypothetical protein